MQVLRSSLRLIRLASPVTATTRIASSSTSSASTSSHERVLTITRRTFSASSRALEDAPTEVEEPKKKAGKSKTPPKARPKAVLPDLIESELEETWVRGSGPGGQAINKTNISCSLLHIPTGIRIQCHETRSRELNRLKARRRMQERLDLLNNPGTSMLETKWKRERAKKEAKKRKGKRKEVVSEDEEVEESGVSARQIDEIDMNEETRSAAPP